MPVHKMEQRSEEWFAIKLGKISASQIKDLMAAKTTAAHNNYIADLVSEIMTGKREENGYVSKDMEIGQERESQAIGTYEVRANVLVERVGFITHETLPRTGASTDGLVGTDGMVEVKCPKKATHIQTVLSGKVPTKYLPQMQWGMACADRKWCDFISYNPDFPENCRLFVSRVVRDQVHIDKLTAAVIAGTAEVEAIVAAMEAYHE